MNTSLKILILWESSILSGSNLIAISGWFSKIQSSNSGSSEILNRKSWIIIPKNKILFTWDSKANDIIAAKNAWFNSINIDRLRNKILN